VFLIRPRVMPSSSVFAFINQLYQVDLLFVWFTLASYLM
jgi:hypothetical protein